MSDLSLHPERLYSLLPALYRMRDAAGGEPLRALLSVLESQLQALEDDIEGLYETWFIETCPEWAIPYIAELLDVRGLPPRQAVSARAYVANTAHYRRRRGTLGVLPALGQSVTGWPVRAVEGRALLGRTQHAAQPQLKSLRTPQLRRQQGRDRVDGPFDSAQHTLDVRRKFHPNKIELQLWRQLSLRTVGGQAALLPGLDTAALPILVFTFSPIGLSAPLFAPAPTSAEPSASAAPEASHPAPLRRSAIQEEQQRIEEAKYQQKAAPAAVYFGAQPAFRIVIEGVDGTRSELGAADLLICDLKDPVGGAAWAWVWPQRSVAGAAPYQAAIDVERGRFVLPKSLVPAGARVRVDYSWGAPAAIGGGYERPPSPLRMAAESSAELVPISGGERSPALNVIDQKLAELHLTSSAAPRHVIVQLEDSLTYRARSWSLPSNVRLELRAASGQRPVLSTPEERLEISCQDGAALSLDGILFCGALSLAVSEGAHASLDLHHSTISPLGTPPGRIGPLDSHAILITGSGSLSITGRRSVAWVDLSGGQPATLDWTDCIIPSMPAKNASVSLRGCTVLGDLSARELTLATDTIFAGAVAIQSARSAIRSCYLPRELATELGTNCQPAMAIRDGLDPVLVTPVFSSLSYGQPGYGRLALSSHPSLRTGASDGGELGAMHHLRGPQRDAALRSALEDYLRLGLEAEIFYAT